MEEVTENSERFEKEKSETWLLFFSFRFQNIAFKNFPGGDFR